MKRNLNFFGEKAEIVLPTTLSGLRKCICDQFLFSENDAEELIITYEDGVSTYSITNEESYQTLLQSNNTDIYISISPDSKLFQEKKKTAEEEEHQALMTQLTQLKKEEENLLKESEATIDAMKSQQGDFISQINKLKAQLIELYDDSMTYYFKQQAKSDDRKKLIKELEDQLGIPYENRMKDIEIPKLSYHKKEKEAQPYPEAKKQICPIKELEPKNKPIHYRVRCDGCNVNPIQGCRYKCAICENFDYCENCEALYKEIHLHPFICYEDVNYQKVSFPYLNPSDFPPFDKKIHQQSNEAFIKKLVLG